MNHNMLISYTDHTHKNESDVQHNTSEIDLLGDIDINGLAPALIPSSSPHTPRSLNADDPLLDFLERKLSAHAGIVG